MDKHDWKVVASVVLTIAVVLGLGAVIVIPKERRADRLHATLPSIHAGMTENEVVKLAGPPDEITQCQAQSSCKFIYHYEVPLEVAGEEWRVWFDTQGRVTHRRAYVSQ